MNTKMKNAVSVRLLSFAAALLGLLFLASTEAYALKLMHEVTPDNLQPLGFSLKAENVEDGMIRFTLTRDLSKARSFPADSDLRVRRSGTLAVFGEAGLLTQCEVEPRSKNQIITYRFSIARNCVAASRFTLAEIDDYKDELEEGLIGGGTFFEFRVGQFLPGGQK
jgi:hypothetical protein